MARNSLSNESNLRMIRSGINIALDAVAALAYPDPENPDGPDIFLTPEVAELADALEVAYRKARLAKETLPK